MFDTGLSFSRHEGNDKTNEDEFLQISGLQHFIFCQRQWGLIHIENQWVENFLTADGRIMHENAHSNTKESRKDILIIRGLNIFSSTMGISGQCDIVEFHRSPNGISLSRREGLWLPYPVEYKRGSPKEHDADELQLCAQAMCLEEMLCCTIPEGSLFYGEQRRRTRVVFTHEQREKVAFAFLKMHELMKKGHTPIVKKHKGCSNCSLKDICLPNLSKTQKPADYMQAWLEAEGI